MEGFGLCEYFWDHHLASKILYLGDLKQVTLLHFYLRPPSKLLAQLVFSGASSSSTFKGSFLN